MSTSNASSWTYHERDYSLSDEGIDENIVEADSFLVERIMSSTKRYNP
jgi:hypothetical protein